jgi:hypothetical protein
LPDDFSRAQFMSLLECPDPYEELDQFNAVRISEFLDGFVVGLATIEEITANDWFSGKDYPTEDDFIRHFLYGNLSFAELESRFDHDGDDGVACNASNLEHLRSRFAVEALTIDIFGRRERVTLADFVVELYDTLTIMISTRREIEGDR